MTYPKQELRRQLRFVRRNLEPIAKLVRLRANLPIDPRGPQPPPPPASKALPGL